jgi:arylsulfatase A-like enzyme
VGLAAFFAALDRRLTLSEARAGVVLPFRTALVLVVVAVASVGLGLVVQENTGGSIPYLGGDVSARGPDLVLIVMDTVRADRTSLYGYRRDTTPHLRQLARRATVYNHAVAPSNYTLPTHASLFTGLYPRRHGAYRVGEVHAPLDESFVTLAEILAERGYATAAVSANSAMVTADFGLAQGFRFFKTHYLLPGGPYLRRAVHKLLAFSGVPILEAQYQSADDISDAVLPLLDDLTARRRPFFLFVNYMDAHSPRTAPARFTRPFSDGSPRLSFGRFKRLRSEIESMKRNLTKAEISFIDAEYDGAVAHVDARIGELVERLKRAGRFENTLLIVTSDHGEALGDHHMFDHGFTVYQHQVGIPLLVKYPRQDAPAAVSSPASLVDVMPTVLDVLGFDIPAGLDGMSLRRLGGSDGHSVFSTSFPHDFHGPKAIERYRTGVEAVVSGSWKLHSYGSGEMELYDLSSDPAEQLDRFKKDSPDVKSLLAHLSEWLASAPKYTSVTKPADQRSLERLKTLGYIQ